MHLGFDSERLVARTAPLLTVRAPRLLIERVVDVYVDVRVGQCEANVACSPMPISS